MGSRLGRSSSARLRPALAGAVLVAASVALAAAPAASATRGTDDVQIAKAAIFVTADFPTGFTSKPPSDSSNAANVRLAKGVAGCAPYITLEKATATLPQAKSPKFEDASRSVSNEVDVFKTERAASDALALYAKPSTVGCLKKLFEKQLRQDPDLKGKLDAVVVTLERQDIAGLGDDSVVYEGKVVLTGTDGSTKQLGIGNAAVQVGRAVDAVTYTTDSGDLTEILTPAIDASVGRLRTALAGQAA